MAKIRQPERIVKMEKDVFFKAGGFTASELVAELNKLIEEYGDLDIIINNCPAMGIVFSNEIEGSLKERFIDGFIIH